MNRVEARQSRELVKVLRSRGAMVLVVHGHLYQSVGWADLIVATFGAPTFYLELKAGRNELSPIQRKRMIELRRRGHPSWCLRDLRWLEGPDGDPEGGVPSLDELSGAAFLGELRDKAWSWWWERRRAFST